RSWRRQLELFKDRLEQNFGVELTEARLQDAIALSDRFRQALKRVLDLGRRRPAPLTGMELMEVAFRASFMPDYGERIRELNVLADALETEGGGAVPASAPRIVLTGVPAGMGSHKVVQLLQDCGASVVCIDNCSCYKKVRDNPEASGGALDVLAARSLDIPCAVMSPNPGRYAAVGKLARDFAADAVVDLTWQGCQTYDVESFSLRGFVHEDLGLPFLQIVTDYAEADTEQLRIRIEAFLEMLA
ncbi:MAG: 2-hydroxyacyl-CoA dehydratase family protein, partial [Desulfovibrio sp.]|nr:2-hydroxyacyl-CoA dehydratase family protein [Desulfovibrio sp.]